MLAFTYRMQQGIVLHIARSNLQDISVASQQSNLFWRHDLGDNGHAGFLAGFCQHDQTGFAQALERIGGGAWFKSAAPQRMGACLAHSVGGFQQLGAAFHRARASDN